MPFRILAGLIGAGFLTMTAIDPEGTMKIASGDLVSLAAFSTVLPLFIYVTFTGKLPDVLVSRLPDSLYEDLAKAETLFTRFDVRSVVAAVVVLILACYSLLS
jgi:hypothetical protein